MSEETQVQDPLSIPAGQADTDFPVLKADRILRFEIVSAVKAAAKSNPNNDVLTLKFKTKTEAVLTTNKTHPAGFPVIHRIGLTETPPAEDGSSGGRTLDAIARDLNLLIKACYGKNATVTARMVIDDPATILEGQVLDCRVGIEKDKSGIYPDKNRLTFVPPNS